MIGTDCERIIVVSNRLPLTLTRHNGRWQAKPSSGGLISAMVPVLQRQGGLWVGWPGTKQGSVEELRPTLAAAAEDSGYAFEPVSLTEEEERGFYYGFSNEIIWPLFHDLFTACNFDSSYWRTYERVNAKFAEVVARSARPNDFIWVHDYHLMELAKALRDKGVSSRIGFFLHIPFPPLEIFLKLPWRFEILHSLLEFDLIGFQTVRDRRNFAQCVRALLDVPMESDQRMIRLHVDREPEGAHRGRRQVLAGTFPIGIDYPALDRRTRSTAVEREAQALQRDFNGHRLILGVDRLDYTKGLPSKLQAFREALRRYPEMRRKVHLVQHVVPSRHDIPAYRRLRLEIERLVGEINGEFTEAGWVPIHYMYHSLPKDQLLAYYRRADMALVTPLKDGMNLVAKEYCACQSGEQGVLILSEFAGSAAQLQDGALLVNPYDVDGTAAAIHRGFTMSTQERAARMRKLRRAVGGHDVFAWADNFLGAALNERTADFPLIDDYLPEDDVELAGRHPAASVAAVGRS